ncbi:terminase large subunit [Vibrio phage 1.155.O._10N.222.55.B3]|nr:terminase large subunit [Vibrio phage 1.155.O._10N.222.55.B3]
MAKFGKHRAEKVRLLELKQEQVRRLMAKYLKPPFFVIPKVYRDLFGDRSAKYIVLKGGRGSGKTFAAVAWLIEESFNPDYKDCTFLFLREIMTSIEESVFSVVADLIKQAELDQYFKILKSSIVNIESGVKFSFTGIRSTGGKTAFSQVNKLKGKHKVKYIFGDEGQDFAEESLNVLFPTVNRGGKIKLYRPRLNEELDTVDTRFIFAMNPNFDVDPVIAKIQNMDGARIAHVNIFDLEPEFQDKQLLIQAEQEKDEVYHGHVWLGEPHHKISGYPFAQVESIRTNDEIPCIAFLDPSFMGGDFTALTFLGSRNGELCFWGKVWRSAWNTCIDDICEELYEYTPTEFHYEANSLGSVPEDLFAERRIRAFPKLSLGNKHNRIYKVAAYTAFRLKLVNNRCNTEYVTNILKYNEEAENDDAPDSLASACLVSGVVSDKMKF